MTFTESISTCFSKYATFKGTASRSEYWWFYLFCCLIPLVLSIADAICPATIGTIGSPAVIVFMLATFLPSYAACVRRLHDTDRTGWFLLLNLVPIIGPIILFVFLVQSTRPNRYGEIVPVVEPPAPAAAEPGQTT